MAANPSSHNPRPPVTISSGKYVAPTTPPAPVDIIANPGRIDLLCDVFPISLRNQHLKVSTVCSFAVTYFGSMDLTRIKEQSPGTYYNYWLPHERLVTLTRSVSEDDSKRDPRLRFGL